MSLTSSLTLVNDLFFAQGLRQEDEHDHVDDHGDEHRDEHDDDHNDHATTESSCTGTCLRNWRIIFTVLLFAEGILFAHIVLFIRNMTSKSQDRFATIARYGHVTAAGIFLSTGFMHILPEAIELFSSDGDVHGAHEASFPWVFFTLICGFYGFILFEQILIPKLFGTNPGHHGHDTAHINNHGESAKTLTDIEEGESKDDDKSAGGPQLEKKFFSRAFILAVVQILGISAHSLLESMTLGISNNFSTILNVFIATAAHRWAVAAAIAFNLAASLAYAPFLVAFLVFSAMVPLGVGIGAAISGVNNTLQGVFFALSAATFLYNGAFEGMTDFVDNRKNIGWKYLAAISGAGGIVIVTAILVSQGIHG